MRYLYSILFLLAVSAAAYAAPYLTPGTGWTGSVSEPSAVGSSGDEGYDAAVIARWDVVPHQSFDAAFGVGIIAFHMNGIDRVEFSVEGGAWTTVTEMTLNPRTDAWEYWVMLDAGDFTAGQEGVIEVRAVVYPKTAGRPRVLADSSSTQVDQGDGSLYLVVDKGTLQHPVAWVANDGNDDTGDGTEQNPYQTVNGAITAEWPSSVAGWQEDETGVLDGAVVYLKEGTYTTPAPGWYGMERWVTVSAAPGADPANVIINSTGGGRCNIGLLKYSNLTWQPDGDQTMVLPSRGRPHIWFDRITGVGGGRESYGAPWVNQGDASYTGCTITNFSHGVQTWNGTTWLARDVHIDCIREDAFRVNKLIVNSSVNDIDVLGSSAHPDVIQAGTSIYNNFIVFNLKATNIKAQGIYMGGTGWALVNVFIEQEESGHLWQIDKTSVDHALLWHCGTVGQNLMWRTGDATTACKNISIRNCVWQTMGCGTASDGASTDCGYLGSTAMTIDNNHFIEAPFNTGSNSTTGAVTYADAGGDDYRPVDGSALVKRSTDMLVPCDVNNNPRADTTAVGAFAGESEQGTAVFDLTDGTQAFPLTVWPNPMGDYINIEPETPHRGVSTVYVHNRGGDVVWTYSPKTRRVASLRWDGTNHMGHPVPPGVYFISDGRPPVRIMKTE